MIRSILQKSIVIFYIVFSIWSICEAADVDYYHIWWYENGVYEDMLYIEPETEIIINRDPGSRVDVRIFQNSPYECRDFFYADINNSRSIIENVCSWYHTFNDFVGPNDTQVLVGIEDNSDALRLYVYNIVPQDPDLVVSNITVDDMTSPRTYLVGETVSVESIVWNNGNAIADTNRLGYYIGTSPSSTNNTWGYDSVSSLEQSQGSSESANYTFSISDIGTRYFVFMADYQDVIDEGENEDNNLNHFGPFTVVEAPNSCPTLNITAPSSNVTVVQGQTVTIAWDGTDPDSEALVSLFADNDTNSGNGTSFNIAVGRSEDGSYPWDTTGVTPGTYYIGGVINDGDCVAYDYGAQVTISPAVVCPTLNITAPSSNVTVVQGQTVTIAWDGTDPDSEALVSLFADNDTNSGNGTSFNIAVGRSEDGSYPWDTTGVTPGTYYIGGVINDGDCVAYDYGAQVTISPAVVCPTLNITAPSSNVTVVQGQTVTIAWDGTDPDSEALVSLFADNDTNSGNGTSFNIAVGRSEDGSYPWDTTGVTPGTYYIGGVINDGDCVAYDYGAQVTISPAVVCPTLNITAPSSNVTVVQGQTVTIAWDGTDPDSEALVSLFADNDTNSGNGTSFNIAVGRSEDGSYPWDTTGVTPGTYYIGGVINDGDCVAYDYGAQVTISPAVVCPTLNITAPSSNVTVVQGQTVTIAWDGTDPDSEALVSLFADNDTNSGNGTSFNIAVGRSEDGSYPWDTTGVTPGTYYIGGVINDGDCVAYDYGAQVTISPAVVCPTLNITAPSSNVTVVQGQTVTIAWDGTDPDSEALVSLFADNDTNSGNGTSFNIAVGRSEDGSYPWDTTGVTPGTYYIGGVINDGDCVAYDYASGRITITSDDCPVLDVPNVISPLEGTTVHSSSITLSWSEANGQQWPLQIQTSEGDIVFSGTVTGDNNYVLNGLTNGSYQWRVSSITGEGCISSWSGWNKFSCLLMEEAARIPESSLLTLPVDGQLQDIKERSQGINGNLNTVVITHGWNVGIFEPEEIPELPSWVISIANEISKHIVENAISDLNIVAWNWGIDATGPTPASFGKVASNTPTQGILLSERLYTILGSGYDGYIQFIGHSMGSRVNRHAVDDLHLNGWSPDKTQVTILDGAEFGDLDTNLWDKCIPNQALFIDNYISAFGSLHPEASNVILREGILIDLEPSFVETIDSLFSFHGYAYEWYIESIKRPLESPMGFGRSVLWDRSIILAENTAWEQTGSGDNKLELSSVSWSDAEWIMGGRNILLMSEYALLSLNAIQQGPIEFFGSVVAEVVEKIEDKIVTETVRLILSEGSPAYLWMQISIPENAEFLSFDFSTNNEVDGDILSMGINNNLVFSRKIVNPVNQGPINSGFINISEYSGETVEFFFGLNSVGSPNSSISLDNIKFHYQGMAINSQSIEDEAQQTGGGSGGGCFIDLLR